MFATQHAKFDDAFAHALCCSTSPTRPFSTTTVHDKDTQTRASLRTYDQLHGDTLVPHSFVVPKDPEWPPECHGYELGRHLQEGPLKTNHATSTLHQWEDVVKPRLQRYFEQRQDDPWLQDNPDYADDLFEFGLGWLVSMCPTDPEVAALHKIVQHRGHFVSGYPERVAWLRKRGVDSNTCTPGDLPGAWDHTDCPWQWCRGDESLHYMLCLESKICCGSSWAHTTPYYTKQQKERMFLELQRHFNKLDHELGQGGQINVDQVGKLVQSVTEVAVAYKVSGWDEVEYAELLETEYANRPNLEEVWMEFSTLVDLDMNMGNPWEEAAGRYRDTNGLIISSPMWEHEKAYRATAEGLASLRFSCHDTPGYMRGAEWVSLQ